MYTAGFLSGHLQAWVLRRSRDVTPGLLLACAAYASVLATGEGRRALGDLAAGDLLKAHTYACIRVHQKNATLEEPEERSCSLAG